VKLANGQTVIADDGYIRESIQNPNAKLVAGFQPIMPTFQGQVSEETLLALIAYIRSLNAGGGAQSTAAGQPGASPAGAGASPAMSPSGPGGGQDLNLKKTPAGQGPGATPNQAAPQGQPKPPRKQP
jgi:hypothetical protein